MQSLKYQIAVAECILRLKFAKNDIIDSIFQVSINGELAEWAETIEVDDSIYFSRPLFESISDPNVIRLLKLVSEIETSLADLEGPDGLSTCIFR